MTSVFVSCSSCAGYGHLPPDFWESCPDCGQLGRIWAPGAPLFGCTVTLADRFPGEIVTLGNGDHGRILWQMPRKTKKVSKKATVLSISPKKVTSEGMFLGLIEEFTSTESCSPVPYPSCVGVASVDLIRVFADDKAHDRERDLDLSDPVHRQIAGRLI